MRKNINPNELHSLLETIDILKLITLKGKKEVKEFSRYMMIWGGYAFVAVFTGRFLGLHLWLPLLYPAFFLTTAPIAGWSISLLTWTIAGLIPYAVWKISSIPWLTILVIILTAVLSYIFLYGLAVKKKQVPHIPLKVMVGPKIGWSWGILMGGMGIVFSSFIRHLPKNIPWDFISITLWGYALGVGLFISGIISPGFFWIGIVGIFAIPLASYINTTIGIWVYLGVTCLMIGYSAYLYKNT